MKKTFRLKVDATVLKEALAIAAEEGTDLSGLVTTWMKDLVAPSRRCAAGRKYALQRAYASGTKKSH